MRNKKGFVKCVDKNFNIMHVKKDDIRLLSGEVAITQKMYITAKDANGKIHNVFRNDIRLTNGELFPCATKYFTQCEIHGRQPITYHARLSKVQIPEQYKIYCPKCHDYYLSDEYIPTDEDKEKCIQALEKIHFISSNQQTPKYFSKYMPQFYKIINEFSIENTRELLFSDKIYFLKNRIFRAPKCNLNSCENKCIVVKRPGFGFGLYCDSHKNSNYSSKYESEIYEFINQNYFGNIEKNYRKINNKELDIYLPDLKLGIEFNGLYWHSDQQKNKLHHFNKFVYFKNLGINMISIWQDEWDYKKEIVKSILLNYLGAINQKINARECTLSNINDLDKTKFLNSNHIQGNCQSSINLGLYYNSELVSIMTFGKKRMILGNKHQQINEYEILRFCSKCNYSVRGGASKLFKYFIDNYKPNKIISYSNSDLGDGNLYDILGFKNNGYTKLNYWWTDFQKRYHRSSFMKHKLVKEGYDKNKTESEIMYERGFAKIWGVGNNKWTWQK